MEDTGFAVLDFIKYSQSCNFNSFFNQVSFRENGGTIVSNASRFDLRTIASPSILRNSAQQNSDWKPFFLLELTFDNNNNFRGLDLSLDPDIVAAMDDDFDYEDPDNELDDDFILKAMGEGEEDEGEEGSDQDWESDSDRMGGRSEDEDDDEVRNLFFASF